MGYKAADKHSTPESHIITRDGHEFDQHELESGFFGKEYRKYEMWLAVLLTARLNLILSKGSNKVLKQIEETIGHARFQSGRWLDAMELNLLSENRNESNALYTEYKLKEAKLRLVRKTGVYNDTDTERFWKDDATLLGELKPDVVDLFKVSMRNLEEWNERKNSEQGDLF